MSLIFATKNNCNYAIDSYVLNSYIINVEREQTKGM